MHGVRSKYLFVDFLDMKYTKIPVEVSIYLRYLHQHGGVKGRDLVKRYPQYSPRSIYRHASLPVNEPAADRRKQNKGRPRALNARDERHLESGIKRLRRTEEGVFNSVHLQRLCGLQGVSNRSVRRALNRKGYGYRQCRKKGQLTWDDCKKRLKFAQNILKNNLSETFWTEGVAFYIDGVSFVHKTNPCAHAKSARTRSWRRADEGLTIHCTAKAKKEGTGGSVAKFMVSVAHGKGVIGVHQYFGPMNGPKYADIVRKTFPDLFQRSANPTGRYFVQDNDPSQNSAAAKEALAEVNAWQFKIPARSPDLNPIENIFHLVSKQIRLDAKRFHLQSETFPQFSHRCKRVLENFPVDVIDKTIASMHKRIKLVIEKNGQRTKY